MQKQRFLTGLFLTFFLLTLGACGSAKKKAKELLESENYDEAVRLYEQVLRSDANDAEAQVGLKRAQDGALDKGLISVRMTRLAGNQQQAADLLLGVIKKEQAWNHSPTSKVAFTQSEESGFAVRYLQGRVKTVVQENKPLLAESLLVTYQPVFQDPQSVTYFDSLRKEVIQSGKSACSQFQVEGRNFPYFSDFITRYCQHFESECNSCAQWSQSKWNDLYRVVDVSASIADLPVDMDSVLKSDLQKAFNETPWYSASGKKKVNIQLTGTYRYSHQKDLASLVHNYQVEEPYETIENVTRNRQVPYTDYESRLDPVSNQLRSMPVTKYRTEYYQEPQRVVRYRTVDKSYPYNAIRHVQRIDLNMTGGCDVADQKLDLALQGTSNEEQYEHTLNLPQIGLTPSSLRLMDAKEWVKNHSLKLARQLKDRAQSEWASQYCSADSGTLEQSAVADRVQKCLRSSPSSVPAFVNQWYETHLGLNHDQVEQLFSKKHL